MLNKGLFTSNTGEWETPQEFFDKLNKEFDFKLDVCATFSNRKCYKYFNEELDGLEQNWSDCDGWKWMNPPYGRDIKNWVKKASESKMVVALLPSRTDTRWFHDFIYNKHKL